MGDQIFRGVRGLNILFEITFFGDQHAIYNCDSVYRARTNSYEFNMLNVMHLFANLSIAFVIIRLNVICLTSCLYATKFARFSLHFKSENISLFYFRILLVFFLIMYYYLARLWYSGV